MQERILRSDIAPAKTWLQKIDMVASGLLLQCFEAMPFQGILNVLAYQ